ncbi:MAG TPA: radical SAM protein [Anaerolineae bacterium]|nr:radical SAM protein [Anaerolineae bacterium]
MRLTGLHLLLTYQCNFECDHCFVWGSPTQSGTMTLGGVRHILKQARKLGTVEWIYFEGGEPFLYYPILARGVAKAVARGFKVGIVTNAYWAIHPADAVEWLRPFARQVDDLTISTDFYHYGEVYAQQAENARAAADALNLPLAIISVATCSQATGQSTGQLPHGESPVMFRGRAAARLAPQAPHHPWAQFDTCPYEDLREPGRLHVDPLGHLHVCHGISLGNLFDTPLAEICAAYAPDDHPICGPLLAGGPAELVRRYDVPHEEAYADACHLCDAARRALRSRFPEILAPDQMYR